MGLGLSVDPPVYRAASAVFGRDMVDALIAAGGRLASVLADSSGMAGSDPAGTSWGSRYDESAPLAVSGVQDVINAGLQLAALLEQTGFNHAAADAASASGGRMGPDTTPYGTSSVYLGSVPISVGGSGVSLPSGWSWVASAVGSVWPNGHQDRLRAAAAAWSESARAIDATADLVPRAIEVIAGQVSPETDDAITACTAMQQHVWELAATHRSLSDACSEYATALDRAHSDVEAELRSFVEWTAGIEVAGGVFAVFTVGMSEAAAQAAEAARAAITAARVGAILSRFATEAALAGEFVAGVLERVATVTGELKAVLARTIIRADVETVPAVRATHPAEQAALAGLRVTAERARVGPEMVVDSKQAGLKIGKHAPDFGRDAKHPLDRQWVRDRIDAIRACPDEVRCGPWNPNGGGGTAYWFYRQGPDVIVTDDAGMFVTILKDGNINGWFTSAKAMG